ncbi:hypothetical protein VTK73DRAFT_6380 [Phialemonium thermophilum]|uniref:Asparaginase n=1 Tax=Phialemonium thermophilum TaxID=223376 RepID=A0ABR3XWE7_9PEZI
MDGTAARTVSDVRTPTAAVFIHAGAGYHSTANERIHLEACSDAARIAMRFLRDGADATTAVEAAIKFLEDIEITNAGYGSNLSIEGLVEGDATIIDHLGRSGACGAVPCIKNPISLARLILDASTRPLSLSRVPPNILVGAGAKQFAEENGMPSIMNELLVSKNAKDRFIRWHKDMKDAEEARVAARARQTPRNSFQHEVVPTTADLTKQRDHLDALLTATWNEGQRDSPVSGYDSARRMVFSGHDTSSSASSLQTAAVGLATPLRRAHAGGLPGLPASVAMSEAQCFKINQPKLLRYGSEDSYLSSPDQRLKKPPSSTMNSVHGCPIHPDDVGNTTGGTSMSEQGSQDYETGGQRDSESPVTENRTVKRAKHKQVDADVIHDTVGAIVIDFRGRIAAGSSSGGIGMKHRGRVGPAALAGIGTAVIPVDPEDEEETSVAAVTSGTGEHMATSFASYKCAERLYQCNSRGPGGLDVPEPDEDAVIESFVRQDFMGHPGVKAQLTPGAIGVMAVKKTKDGYYFYFAHNTDSFVLASMASTESQPVCTMSRMGNTGGIVRGGRRIKLR